MRDNDLIIISLLGIICFTLYIGFSEIFLRLRPRVVYVYGDHGSAVDGKLGRDADDKKDDIPIWNNKRDKETA